MPSAPFSFDGKEFSSGRIRVAAPRFASVEGYDFPVPIIYVPRLVEGDLDAWRFLEEVAKAPILRNVKMDLLAQACSVGFTSARETLNLYVENAPDRPRLYMNYECYRRRSGLDIVEITDGREALAFRAICFNGDFGPLPPNVYRKARHPMFSLKFPERYVKVAEDVEGFFQFMKRLRRVKKYAPLNVFWRCYATFFEERERAHQMLAEMERRTARRVERDRVWRMLERKKVLECSAGYIVYAKRGIYCVEEEGCRVLKLNYHRNADLKEAVHRIHKGGKLRNRHEVTDPHELKQVAQVLGGVRPELAVVIA